MNDISSGSVRSGESTAAETKVIAGFIEAKKISPVSGSEIVNASQGIPFQLTVGQTMTLEPEVSQLSFMSSVEFQAIEEDSRCPPDVVCVKVGRAIVKLSAQLYAVTSGPQELTLVGSATNSINPHGKTDDPNRRQPKQ